MIASNNSSHSIRLSLATAQDREHIYAARHEVYARELRQHSENPNQSLRDPLDERNEYIVARAGERLVGFVSITPPGGRYSIDKYFSRERVHLEFDAHLYEIRLLTVLSAHRGRLIAGVLMYAALRYVESHNGRHLVAIGRHEVLDLYERCGMDRMGLTTQAGAVEYELISARTEDIHKAVCRYEAQLRRMEQATRWELPFQFRRPDVCVHGGRFWTALGDDFHDLARAGAIVNADVLDAWFDPAPAVIQSLQENLPLLLKTSPPTYAEGLVKAIAEARSIPPSCILTAAGSSALIFLALPRMLNPRSRVLILEPAYGEYRHILQNVVGCELVSELATRSTGFQFDLNGVARKIAAGCDLVVIINPNSPTGVLVDSSALKSLCRQFSKTRFWIDETYIEYAGVHHSLEQVAAGSGNVFVCKSMSKVYALSGARAAYLVGPEDQITSLRTRTPPWSVSLPAQVAATAALASQDYYAAQHQRTTELRDMLAAQLRRDCGIQSYQSVTNFFLCDLPKDVSADEAVRLARAGKVFFRTGAEIHPSLGPGMLRIAVKDQPMNLRMVKVLRDIVEVSRRPSLR